jgi:hypothetical protein
MNYSVDNLLPLFPENVPIELLSHYIIPMANSYLTDEEYNLMIEHELHISSNLFSILSPDMINSAFEEIDALLLECVEEHLKSNKDRYSKFEPLMRHRFSFLLLHDYLTNFDREREVNADDLRNFLGGVISVNPKYIPESVVNEYIPYIPDIQNAIIEENYTKLANIFKEFRETYSNWSIRRDQYVFDIVEKFIKDFDDGKIMI